MKNDQYKCNRTINNFFGQPLFEKDKIYKVIFEDEFEITLNHNLYANEFMGYPREYINENFTKL